MWEREEWGPTPGVSPSPARFMPAQRWVDEFAYVEEIPCADRFVPIERDLVRIRKRRARSLEAERRRAEREEGKAARKRETARLRAERELERDKRRLECPFCHRLIFVERLCATCVRRGRERLEREQAEFARLPVTSVIVVLADKSEVTLSPEEYRLLSGEAYARRIDERRWIALRLGLLAA